MSGDGNRLEDWKKAGECRDFPQPWSDYLWSLEFEHRPDDAKAFHSVAKAVCEQCPVRAECLAYAASGGLEWGVYGGKVCTDRRRIARMAEADGVPCRDRSLPWPQRWRLLTDWIRSHLNVFDEATGEASAERQQRRLRARRTGQPSRPT